MLLSFPMFACQEEFKKAKGVHIGHDLFASSQPYNKVAKSIIQVVYSIRTCHNFL